MALPTWRIQLHKQIVSEEWTNDYLTDVETMEDAVDLLSEILTFEKAIHSGIVVFTYARVSSFVEGDRTFRHITLNELGTQPSTAYLPLFNTARMDMQTNNADPCRKYYRMPVREDMQENGIINGTTLDFLNGYIAEHLGIEVLSRIVSTKGNNVISASFHNQVQIRQLHRRRKKKQTP